MIKRIFKHKIKLVFLGLLCVMLFGITINQSLAYFTAYTDAWGSKALSLSRSTELEEDIEDEDKEISIKNTSEVVDIYTRVKVFYNDDNRVEVSISDLGADKLWKYNEANGYWYYTKPIAPQESTSILKASVSTKIAEDDTNPLEIIVVHEYVTAIYNEDNTGNMDLSWQYGMEVINNEVN